MSTLAIYLNAPGAAADTNIAGEIFEAAGHRVWRGAIELNGVTVVPNISSGDYMVRAHFPSGEDATGNVRVTDNPANVSLVSPGAASEWRWVSYLRRRPLRRQANALPREGITIWRGEVALASRMHWRQEVYAPGSLEGPSDAELLYYDELGRDGVFAHLRTGDAQTANVQLWLQIGARLFAVPATPRTDIIVTAGASGDFAVSVHNEQAAANVVLGYLLTGDLESARTVAPHLIGKSEFEGASSLGDSNPAAALVVGYYLMRAAPAGHPPWPGDDRFYRWSEDIYDTFPGFSDGAVIFGWAALRRREFPSAREAFLTACWRGLPTFTFGLRHLFDGLRLLRLSGHDDAIEEALEWLMNVARDSPNETDTTSIVSGSSDLRSTPFSPFQPSLSIRRERRFPIIGSALGESEGLDREDPLRWVQDSPDAAPEAKRNDVRVSSQAARTAFSIGREDSSFGPALVEAVSELRDAFAGSNQPQAIPEVQTVWLRGRERSWRAYFVVENAVIVIIAIDAFSADT